MSRGAIVPQWCVIAICPEAAIKAAPFRLAEQFRVCRGGCRMALVVGLVSLAVIWLVVIYGSIYVNKNVQ
jgi:hypothetical protein